MVISGIRALQRYFSGLKKKKKILSLLHDKKILFFFFFFLLHNTKKQAVGTHEKASKFIYICSHLKARQAGEVPLAETVRAKRPSVNEPAVSAKTTVINPAAPTVVSFDDRVGTICF